MAKCEAYRVVGGGPNTYGYVDILSYCVGRCIDILCNNIEKHNRSYD
jgi:hypothetical protein